MKSSEPSLSSEGASLSDSLDTQTAGVASENGMRRSEIIESSKEGLLDGEILYDSLDDEICRGDGGSGIGRCGDIFKRRFDESGLISRRIGMQLLGDTGDGLGDDGATVVEGGVGNVGHDFFGI